MTPVHNEGAKQFVISADDGEASVSYVHEDDAIVVTHTFVPPAWRGRGVGGLLLRALCDWARREQHPVNSRCDYASVFFRRHPELVSRSADADST